MKRMYSRQNEFRDTWTLEHFGNGTGQIGTQPPRHHHQTGTQQTQEKAHMCMRCYAVTVTVYCLRSHKGLG